MVASANTCLFTSHLDQMTFNQARDSLTLSLSSRMEHTRPPFQRTVAGLHSSVGARGQSPHSTSRSDKFETRILSIILGTRSWQASTSPSCTNWHLSACGLRLAPLLYMCHVLCGKSVVESCSTAPLDGFCMALDTAGLLSRDCHPKDLIGLCTCKPMYDGVGRKVKVCDCTISN